MNTDTIIVGYTAIEQVSDGNGGLTWIPYGRAKIYHDVDTAKRSIHNLYLFFKDRKFSYIPVYIKIEDFNNLV